MMRILIAIAVFGLYMQEAHAGKVVLTSDDVHDAIDIENAIGAATASGSERGLVLLDGSKGDFVYTGPDRSINVGVSNFELRGINGAVIANCDGGLFLNGGVSLSDMKVDNIEFRCNNGAGTGIQDGARPGDVRIHFTIQHNKFFVQGFGAILIINMSNSHILDNLIVSTSNAGVEGIGLAGGGSSQVIGNEITGFLRGVTLAEGAQSFNVIHNVAIVRGIGVLLATQATENNVIDNALKLPGGTGTVGIFLDPSTSKNHIIHNAISGAAQTVIDQGKDNHLVRNM